MKRFVLPLMMVFTMFLLVSCASEEYKKGSALIEETTKNVNEATDYESLDDAMELFYAWEDSNPTSRLSTKESIKLDKQAQELKRLSRTKREELIMKEDAMYIVTEEEEED